MVKSRVYAKNLRNEVNLESHLFTRPKAGTLKHGRSGHGVIFDGEKFLVIGGKKKSRGLIPDPVETEVCTLHNSTMTCVDQSTSLDQYVYYPELFLVTEDPCST